MGKLQKVKILFADKVKTQVCYLVNCVRNAKMLRKYLTVNAES